MPNAPFSVSQLLALGRLQSVALAPSGTWMAACVARVDPERARFVPHLYRVQIADGAVTQLTRGKHGCRSPRFRADGTLGFLTARPTAGFVDTRVGADDDTERDQVWVLPAIGGESFPITDEPLGVSAFRFARAANVLVLVADILLDVPLDEQRARALELNKKGPSALHYTRMPVRHWDHWVDRAAPHLIAYDARGRHDLTPDQDREHREGEFDVSADGRFVIATESVPGTDRVADMRLRLFDLAELASTLLVGGEQIDHGRPLFSPDGQWIACTRTPRSTGAHGKSECVLYETATGARRTLAVAWDRWPVPEAFTPDGSRLVITVDDGGTVPVCVIDLARDEVVRITAPAAGGTHEQISIAPSGEVIVGIRSTFSQPPEPFISLLNPDSAPRIVARLSGLEEPLDFADVTSIDVAAVDGETIQSWVVSPRRQKPSRVLFWVHGGPVHQFADQWHWRWNPQVFAARGWLVVLPNPRGSTGRGQAFVEGIWNNAWGGTCYDDLMRVADAVAERSDARGDRMAVMGGSFGGYMANWIGGSTQRFRAIVTHASVFHMEGFALTTDYPSWFYLTMAGATPSNAREAYDRFAPHRRVAQWKTPALVIHGEKDYRVPIGEGLALFESLQHHGVESEFLVYPDEGHWITKPRNIASWYESIAAFLEKHIGD